MSSHLPPQLFFAASLYEHLLRYQTGDCAFVSPRQALLGAGVALERTVHGHDTIPGQARDMLSQARQDGWSRAVLISAIPFCPQAQARLVIPRYVEAIARQPQTDPPLATAAASTGHIKALAPTPDRYRELVSQAVEQIQAGLIDKVVLSRTLTVEARVQVASLLAGLAHNNPAGYSFAFERQRSGTPRTLVGASPELLLSKYGPRIWSNPLAGSLPRSPDVMENRRRSEYLLHSPKDLHEHALVVDAMVEALAPHCKSLQVPDRPSVLETPTMLHLSTAISGELKDPETSSLELALALHPTPAVCGHPLQPARDFIRAQEGFDRDLFTGLVGWCGADGNGEWAVTIRCADVSADDVTLYAGAGIVAGSQPEQELAETGAKMRTMLAALGIEHLMEVTA